MNGQIINYTEIDNQLSIIKISSETTRENLHAIDSLIDECVGSAGTAWSGESAIAFRTSWDELAERIPSIIQTVENQVSNIEVMLEKTKAVDTAETGTVTE